MSRSRNSFFSNSSGTNDQNHPLLSSVYDPHNDVHLQDLSSPSASRATPSPPPEFYRDMRSPTSASARTLSPRPISESGSASKFKGNGKAKGRRIQFAAPPPPIVGSVAGLGNIGRSLDGSGSSHLRGSVVREGRGIGILKSVGSAVGSSAQNDSLLGLERRERALQAELQMLLDAQSEGLMQGFGGGGNREEHSGSSTPTTRSLQRDRDRQGGRSTEGAHMRTIPVRQPKRKSVGLRGSRKGLLRNMGLLAGVKVEEGELLTEEIKRREMCIAKTKDWKIRIDEVKREIGEFVSADITNNRVSSPNEESHQSPRASKSEEDREIAELRTEERAVENEIRETEDRLLQMKARRSWLADRINERVNQRESRLSSYRGALREVESEVQEFLTRPPTMVSISMGNEEGFMALPPKRRTLEMAEEWWSKEINSLQARKLEVQKEKEALEDGAKLWEESVKTVVNFEDELRENMKSGKVGDVEGLKMQIGKMKTVIGKLAETERVAESKRWNLLVVAVGAELQAFKQGEEILREALGSMGGGDHSDDYDYGRDIDIEKAELKGDNDERSIDTDMELRTTHSRDGESTTDDDGLKELQAEFARQERREGGMLGEGRVSVDREGGDVDADADADVEESDEEKHLRELMVGHSREDEENDTDHEGF
ncbi:putative autophagy-related protein 28 protein [Botrytis fragariae]|uniref:Putative autophagy-related protein 28 protein n=1 Tax=Botrytis fragariae TaxID=1964551 RepID=A0A8H6B275_9HELO|nr:putative autophagy-related protein 28 protein [Botrytis fragariae]KAF5877986.1 putative autophagy-related protein 28 protein [Botrytis fragariae]